MRIIQNIMVLSRALRLQRIDARQLHTGLWDGVLALIIAVISRLMVEAMLFTEPMQVNLWALNGLAGWYGVFVLLLICAGAAILAFKETAALVIATIYIWSISNLAIGLMSIPQFAETTFLLFAIVALPSLLTLLIAFALLRGRPMIALLRAFAFVAIIAGGQYVIVDYIAAPNLFVAAQSDEEVDETYVHIETEDLYAAQHDLLDAQTATLRPGTLNQADLFGLVIGGTAYQSVFRSEATQVTEMLEQRYDAKDRVLTLVNSSSHPTAFPMANKTNMRQALKALAQQMEGEEDIAFLYLTSHGHRDVFSLDFYQAGLSSLSAQEFSGMIDQSGLRNLVIVISACYSGSFIDDLAAEDRLIITAASDSTTSFGCADGVDWTWWGRAYFEQGLAQDRDFRTAFDSARKVVTAWEEGAGYTPSQPQISEGARIRQHLDNYFSQRAALGNASAHN